MEDEKIRFIFEKFNPDLTPSSQFINETLIKLEKYEIVKQSLETRFTLIKARCIFSTLIGFICGIFFTIYFSYIRENVKNFLGSLYDIVPNLENEIYTVFTWLIISILIILIIIASYCFSNVFIRKTVDLEN